MDFGSLGVGLPGSSSKGFKGKGRERVARAILGEVGWRDLAVFLLALAGGLAFVAALALYVSGDAALVRGFFWGGIVAQWPMLALALTRGLHGAMP